MQQNTGRLATSSNLVVSSFSMSFCLGGGQRNRTRLQRVLLIPQKYCLRLLPLFFTHSFLDALLRQWRMRISAIRYFRYFAHAGKSSIIDDFPVVTPIKYIVGLLAFSGNFILYHLLSEYF